MRRIVLLATWLLALLLIVAGCSLLDDGESAPGASGGDDQENASASAETGTIIINVETVPAGQAGSFTVTGVPSGTLTTEGTLVVSDLAPGTYTTTEIDPAPDFDVSAIECDDDGQEGTPSSGDAQTRTAVINLDAGETVTCTFSNTQRGSAVIASRTEPEGAAGQFRFTGVPSGTIPANGTLVVANLQPGTYTSTEVDPAPQFDLTSVTCDDGGSATVSGGDPSTRSAIFNVDPAEMVTCTFVNTRRAAAIVAVEVDPDNVEGTFQFTGVPSGTVSANGTLLVADLSPGTYATTEVDPAPDFELTEVTCDDGEAGSTSSGDAATRTAIFNLDAGETVTCTFLNESSGTGPEVGDSGGSGSDGGTGGNGGRDDGGTNPFVEPDPDFEDFPQPEELPPDAGTYAAPRPGTWTASNLAGQMDCGGTSIAMPAGTPETGTMEVLDGGATVIGTGISEGVSITMNADPAITGRYTGSVQATEEGVPITIDYYWQVVTDEYIVGYLTSTVTAEGVSCSIYRPYELRYAGE